jgi:hypothetical protein
MANEGQSLLSIIQQLEVKCNRFDQILSSNVEITEDIENELENELIFLVQLFENLNFIEIVDKFRNSTLDNEDDLLEEFRRLTDLEKHATRKVMEIVWKYGITMKQDDAEKRKYWYEKLKNEL